MKTLSVLLLTILISCKEQAITEGTNQLNNKGEASTSCESQDVSEGLKSPQNIRELTDLINALPKPLDIPCLVRNINRPLKVNLTLSSLSAQPAVGRNSPRIFIFLNDLIISVVPEGKGRYFLEASYLYSNQSSLKAEYEFPIVSEIDYKYPFERIQLGANPQDGTTCKGCHTGESLNNLETITNTYTSVALKPESNMSLLSFKAEHNNCELNNITDYRCRMIDAIFQDDQIEQVDFPSDTPRWIDTI